MNLRARLSERVHIEDIREVLHFIQDDKRLREEVYQLIFDEDNIVSYKALWVCTHPEPDMPATCRRPATSGFPRFLHGTHDIT